MPSPIQFSTAAAYQTAKNTVPFWLPYIRAAFKQHQLKLNDNRIIPGYNSTNPVFVCGDNVIKFFGFRPQWEAAYQNEHRLYQSLAQEAELLTPRCIAHGELFSGTPDPWPYLISTTIPGKTWENSELSITEKHTVVAELGKQLKILHRLALHEHLPTDASWPQLDLQLAARQSSLPTHLIDHIPDFIQTLQPFDRVLTNADIVPMHVFVHNQHLSGIIDWGDAVVTDRHYDIGKLVLSHFPGDRELLHTLLQAAEWPITPHFATQSLGLSLYRQAVGLTQHRTFNIFYQLEHLFPFQAIRTLDEFAEHLFQLT